MVTVTSQERFKTQKGVFDEFTHRNIFELVSRGFFDELVSPIFVGKESNVFMAKKGKKKIIVKIYRVQNCDFKRMYAYIKKDPRYEFLKNKRREIIFSWVQREYKNLIRAERGGVRVPKVFALKNHILVEEFIGEEEAAPPLKDAYPEDPGRFFRETVKQMKLLYRSGLIHGDLSAFNILNFKEKPVLIDFSQTTLVRTPNSEDLLKRDLNNILNFFKKLGVEEEFEKIFKEITEKK
jgi:RIO kinase 1